MVVVNERKVRVIKKRNIVIDGRHLCTGFGGVQRYLREILLELDNLVEKDAITVLVPAWGKHIPDFNNLRVVYWGKLPGNFWAQVSLPLYLISHKALGVFLCSTIPFLYPHGILAIHDVMFLRYPIMQATLNKVTFLMLKWNYLIGARKSDTVITVSEESKKDICQYCHISSDKIVLIQNAWQHIQNVKPDTSYLEENSWIRKGEFYLALSANRWQKNFQWIVDVAKKNQDSTFIIVGGHDSHQRVGVEYLANVHYTGILSDEQCRVLFENCKAFLFPSFCEGFGIPPLEALAYGATVICSNTSCLPEIFGDSVHYIDPYDTDVCLDEILSAVVSPSENVLSKYSWKQSAEKLHHLLIPYMG